MEKEIQKYKVLFDKLKGNNHFYRLGKLFQTSNNNYFYDMGTGKIFQLSEPTYRLLDKIFDEDDYEIAINSLAMSDIDILKSSAEIVDAVNNENILKAPEIKEFRGPHNEALEYYLCNQMSQLTLEVTEACNLRCRYCIYNESHNDFHGYTNKMMSFDTAKKAIDYAFPRTGENFYVAFYGGEPLLNYELIHKCIEYTNSIVGNKNHGFSLTTNATLITKEIAEYFAKNDVVVLVSLDGPEDIHNENRIFCDGTGSFATTIRGLKFLIEAYGKEKSLTNIFISMVTSGRNIEEKYDKIQEFFDQNNWIPEGISVNTSYVSYGRNEEEYELIGCKKEKEYAKNINNDPLLHWSIAHGYGKENQALFSNSHIERLLHIIHRRDLSNEPMTQYYFNGCCVPGSRRLHINVDGMFLPCERVGKVPFIGNVDSGFDVEAIKKYYVHDFMKAAVPVCKNCWAAHLCTSCYIDCFDENGIHMEYRHNGCKYIRYMLEQSLKLYHEILETNPEALRKLNNIVMV